MSGKIRFRIFLTLLIAICLFVPVYYAATIRQGHNTNNDTWYHWKGQGFIYTSKDDRLFNATGHDLINVTRYMNDTIGGTVFLPAEDIRLYRNWDIPYPVTFKGQGRWETRIILNSSNEVNISGGVNQVDNSWCGRLHDLSIVCPPQYSNKSRAVTIYVGQGNDIRHVQDILDNVYIVNNGSGVNEGTGTGLHIQANGEASFGSFAYNTFGNINIRGFNWGMNLTVNGSGNPYINDNIFESIIIERSCHMLTLNASDKNVANHNQIGGNKFYYVSLNAATLPKTWEGLNLSGRVNRNLFYEVTSWDWTPGLNAMEVNISGRGNGNCNDNVIYGHFDGDFNVRDANDTIIVNRYRNLSYVFYENEVYGEDAACMNISGSLRLHNPVDSSSRYHRKYNMGGGDAALTGATQVFKYGYNGILFDNAATDLAYFTFIVDDDWDGRSDMFINITGWLNAAETANDDIDMTVKCYYVQKDANIDSGVRTQTLTDTVDVGVRNAQYEVHTCSFVVDYDKVTDEIERGDIFCFEVSVTDVGVGHVASFVAFAIETGYRTQYPMLERDEW